MTNQHTFFELAPELDQVNVTDFPYIPVQPLNLQQDGALWMVGQRSIVSQRDGRYLPEIVDHPGKMFPDLAAAIIDTYTQPGDRILDFMSGIQTTGVEAIERGRHYVGVELEAKWARIGDANLQLVYDRARYYGQDLSQLGAGVVIQGDARNLPELLDELFDKMISSPPYGPSQTGRGIALTGTDADPRPSIERCGGAPYDAAVVSPPYGNAVSQHPAATDREARIARMQTAGMTVRAQDIGGPNSVTTAPQAYDAALVSPPYGDNNYQERDFANMRRLEGRCDVAISSPPYGDTRTVSIPSGNAFADGRVIKEGEVTRGYDAAVVSPPYGDIRQDGQGTMQEEMGMKPYSGEERAARKNKRNQQNVGNLKYPEYLVAMHQAYRGCFKVLRPGGLLILVTKDFRRDNRRVNLLGDTIDLCIQSGFELHERAVACLSPLHGSEIIAKVAPFVRINARKAETPQLLPVFEDVTIFRKPVPKVKKGRAK